MFRTAFRTALVTVTAAGLIAALCATPAEAKRKKPRARHAAPAILPHSGFQPARMIEIRPGLFISSYGCYTDDGNGRIGSCDTSNHDN